MLGLVCAEGVRASELTSDFAPLGQRTGVLYHTSLELQKQGRQYHTYAPLPPLCKLQHPGRAIAPPACANVGVYWF